MDESIPEPNLEEQKISHSDASPDTVILKITSIILIALIIYFIDLIYNKL